MVPDFELDVEERIAETSTEMADVLNSLQDPKKAKRAAGISVSYRKSKLINRAIIIISLLIIILVITAIVFMRRSREIEEEERARQNSYEYLIAGAEESYSNSKYKEAAELYRKAFNARTDEDRAITDYARMNFAFSLIEAGEKKEGEEILTKLISEDKGNAQIYEKLILLYAEDKRYERINGLVASCKDPDLYDQFDEYMTLPPDFSEAGGHYSDTFYLSLSANGKGEIYYTLDGTDPTDRSELFTGPIEIGQGKTTVTAIYVNIHNMYSQPVRRTYFVTFEIPYPPEVSPKSGNYSEPEYITATVPETGRVHYTTDGSIPTENSPIYEKPFPMSLGSSRVTFMTISDKGVSSNFVTREYNLNIQGVCSSEDAVNYVAASLVATGALIDIYGNAPGADGHYKYVCSTAAKEGSRIYYLVDEYFEFPDGRRKRTETTYAVEAMSGMMYRASRGKDGRYGFTLFF